MITAEQTLFGAMVKVGRASESVDDDEQKKETNNAKCPLEALQRNNTKRTQFTLKEKNRATSAAKLEAPLKHKHTKRLAALRASHTR